MPAEGTVKVDGDVEEMRSFCGREVLRTLGLRFIGDLRILDEGVFGSVAVTPEWQLARSPGVRSFSLGFS